MNEKTKTTEEIARRVLAIETLETRHRDARDFHDLAVWKVREALEAAYAAGHAAGSKGRPMAVR